MLTKNNLPKYLIVIYSIIFLIAIAFTVYYSLISGWEGFAFLPVIIVTMPTSFLTTYLFDKVGYIDWYGQYASNNQFIFISCALMMTVTAFLINSFIIYKMGNFIVNKFKK